MAQERTPIDVEASTEVLDRSGHLIEVLSAQLGDVVDGTEEAAFGLMSEVQQIDTRVEEMSGLAGELVRRCELGSDEVARRTRASAEDVQELVQLVTDRDRSVLDLVGEVRALDREVDAIAAVAHATTILALNAKIEAVRAGDAGEGFSVVADEVRELSRQSAQAAASVRAGITRVTTLMEERLGSDSGGAGSSEQINARLEGIAAAQHETSAQLSASVEATREVAERIAGSVDALGERSTAALAQTQFQDVTRQSVQSVVGGLEQLGHQLGTVAGHLRGEAGAEALRALDDAVALLRSSYVSQRQRSVHARQDGGAPVAATALVELF
ncbi:methyl-accepting chemotaxis protein [Kineococcus radiotolerans]|uniref:Methyl-accepting chemotaxis sensory transducer n=1 Tax=Kineococcus radiotolerans (strain ATCC BAA-149 / DSM 14245 / SRS30216) TaxID=266940 RepID=A6W951_KINRD|nr:methyl-accepting chemotaxis protein [Kineococcus radiotolerans]ABS03340.1 methyl-accepting chemotaxis sensory transducer [Kineococcus radiotolerans SRS30216 = ATCC BAA-149]